MVLGIAAISVSDAAAGLGMSVEMRVEQEAEAALAAGLAGEEREPEPGDFSEQRPSSLAALLSLADRKLQSDQVEPLLLLCGEHCPAPGPAPWSSPAHQEAATLLLTRLEAALGPVELLLAGEADSAGPPLLQRLLSRLQPRLEQFPAHPAAVRCVVWLVGRAGAGLGPACPALLPHCLRWLDSWLPGTKLAGCRLASLLLAGCPPHELRFYGRAKLLTAALQPLLSHAEPGLAAACLDPLLAATELQLDGQDPALPGPADHLVQVTSNATTKTTE